MFLWLEKHRIIFVREREHRVLCGLDRLSLDYYFRTIFGLYSDHFLDLLLGLLFGSFDKVLMGGWDSRPLVLREGWDVS